MMEFSAGGALFDDFGRDVRAMSRHLPECLFSATGESISGAAAAGVPDRQTIDVDVRSFFLL
ncbi:hypothetical protein [Bradyrhizobium sp. 187]|uniref:hypothetical protein n=1 Tax=Bradyrhizobium sp. 187 TaxID=2782655 RepID=UPI001FFEA3AA|nr:hypothetical protein [Bradyrhizobium sp. 187]UPJ76843.1 hypothetical protein IVB19_38875 [Bradyrhizobium sp. 187]